jgi:tryptophan 2,3-dioxygenase
MTESTITSHNKKEQDREIWLSLREAISTSSGFQSWQKEREVNNKVDLDMQVRRYLEETLETLAY